MRKTNSNPLNEVIQTTIGQYLSHSEPTAREVSDAVIAENEDLILEAGRLLAERQIRAMVADMMKSAIAPGAGGGKQMDLGPEFRNVPSAITFEEKRSDGIAVRYISIRRAKARHIKNHLELLSTQIAADTAKRDAIKALYAKLEPVFEKNPEITVLEAVAIQEGNQEAA